MSGGLVRGLGSIYTRTIAAAVVGGTIAKAIGGKFANGAVTAAFVHLFNNESEKALGRIDKFIRENSGKTISLSREDLNEIMTTDMQTMKLTQRLYGSFSNESFSEYTHRLLWKGDSVLGGYFGEKFDFLGDTFLAQDINYYYQGFITAASGRSPFIMNSLITGHNLNQVITRRSMYDFQQINSAKAWANYGYDFYNANK